jgi:hypothetical protein
LCNSEHLFIHYNNKFIHPALLDEASLLVSLPLIRSASGAELGLALQQANALPTELRRTLTDRDSNRRSQFVIVS